jgi:hypothetical protein
MTYFDVLLEGIIARMENQLGLEYKNKISIDIELVNYCLD